MVVVGADGTVGSLPSEPSLPVSSSSEVEVSFDGPRGGVVVTGACATPGIGIVTPGKISTFCVVMSGTSGNVGIVRDVDGLSLVGGAVVFADQLGTPDSPAILPGLGKDSTSVPSRATYIVSFQMSDGRPDP